MSRLLVINGVDFTGMITVPNYKVNRVDVAETWLDGNKHEHKDFIRTQITGQFTIRPLTVSDFKLFCSTVNTNKILTGPNARSVLASIYVTNEDTVVSAYVRLDFEPENIMPLIDRSDYSGFEVTVTEV